MSDTSKTEEWRKPEVLESAVLYDTPSGTARVFQKLGKVNFTARALGLACRYRGLDMVKALVECGASFEYDCEEIKSCFKKATHRIFVLREDENYSLALTENVVAFNIKCLCDIAKRCHAALLPLNARLRVLEYLLKNSERTGFKPDEFLFYAYITDEREMISMLKSKGVTMSENIIKTITEGGVGDDWLEYCYITSLIKSKDFVRIMSGIVSEIGDKKLHFTEKLYDLNKERFFKHGIFEFFLENFNQTKMNKTALMKEIIDRDETSYLETAEKNGWLKAPKKRDELIGYASERGKTECTAWLLDFKNRTADLAAERERAEKKMQRELNADPNSLTELKKIWRFESCGDNTVIITGYKGDRTEITVPEKIGKDIVSAVGDYAFSPDAKRIREEQRTLRRSITKITLPNTIENIGEFAFFKCGALKHIGIPEKLTGISKGMLNLTILENIVIGGNIRKIGAVAFYGCSRLKSVKICEGVEEIDSGAFYNCSALETIELPRSVTRIADGTKFDSPFWGCRKLTVLLHKGSYAESYCENSGIIYKYLEEQL